MAAKCSNGWCLEWWHANRRDRIGRCATTSRLHLPTKSAHSSRRAALPPGDCLRRRACHKSCPLFESLHHEDAHPTWNHAHPRACSRHSEMGLAQLIPLPGCRTTQPPCRNHKLRLAPTLARCHSHDRMHPPDVHLQTMQLPHPSSEPTRQLRRNIKVHTALDGREAVHKDSI